MPNRGETLANQETINAQSGALVTALSDGSYVVVWSDSRHQTGGLPPITTNPDYYGRHYAADGTAIGNEFVVAASTSDYGYYAGFSLTALSGGDFLVVYNRSQLSAGGSFDVVAQRFNSDGTTDGGVVNIATDTGSGRSSRVNETQSSVATFSDGSYIITWHTTVGNNTTGEVYGQRYFASGQANGARFQVTDNDTGFQGAPDIVALNSSYGATNGRYVIVFQDDSREGTNDPGLYAYIYEANGTTRSALIHINESAAGGQVNAQVAALANGGFVVTWEDVQEGSGSDTYYRVFNASGAEVFTESRVNNTTTNAQYHSAVVALPDGGFLIAWTDNSANNFDVYAQRFDAAGNEIGAEFIVNSTTSGDQDLSVSTGNEPVTVLYSAGQTLQQIVVAWNGNGPGDTNGVFTRQIELHTGPAGADTTKNAQSGVPYVFSASDFGFSDFFDRTSANQSGDSFTSVKITTLPTEGTLTLIGGPNGGAVSAGQIIAVSDIGNLRYNAPSDGDDGSFTFQVIDNGGTTLGSSNTDSSANTFSFNNAPANTPPTVNNNNTSTVLEGGTDTITAAELDFNDDQPDTAITYTLTTLPTNGTLYRDNVALGANGTFTQADINNNLITFTHDGGETTGASFGFSVSDGTNIVSGQTFNFTVTAQNDAPDARNDAIAVDQRSFTQNQNVILGTGTGNVADIDPDLGDTRRVTNIEFNGANTAVANNGNNVVVVGQYGTLFINSAGTYSYLANVEGLIAVGATATDVFTYTIADSANVTDTATLSVTVTGSAVGDVNNNIFLLTGPGTSGAGMDGDDLYIVDGLNDVADETGSDGTDSVYTTVDFNAGTNGGGVEYIIARRAGLSLTGNNLNNRIYDFTGTDPDGTRMNGGGGSDRFYVTNANSAVNDTGLRGADSVYTTVDFNAGTDGGGVEYIFAERAGLSLTGNNLNNRIYDFTGTDPDGTRMNGGGGSDRFYVTNANSAVNDTGLRGADSVYTTVDFNAGTDGGGVEYIFAERAGLSLTGNNLKNRIYDFGTDSELDGGAGNDIFYVRSASTTVSETSASGGMDSVYASTSFTLGANIENLYAAASTSLSLTGNVLKNRIMGGDGADFINGKGGADFLTGGLGNDTFVFDTALGSGNIDTIVDFNGSGDTISLSNTVFSGLTFEGPGGTLTEAEFASVSDARAYSGSALILYEAGTGKLFYDSNGSETAGGIVQFATLSSKPADIDASDFFCYELTT